MGKCLKLCALVLGSVIAFGCAGQKNGSMTAEREASYRHNVETALKENDPSVSGKLVKKAKSAIGTPYVFGGSKPGGFDCSGLVKWAYNSVGVELPRTAREQSVVGEKVKDVKDMRAGDIVAFRHPKRGYHTGIYVGNGKFVHSPRKRSSVRINSLSDPYFNNTLLGARRVSLSGSENLVAQAEERLRGLVAEKTRLAISARNLEKIRAVSKKANAKPARNAASKTAKTVQVATSKKNVKTARATASIAKNKNSAKINAAAKNKKSGQKAATVNSRKSSQKVAASAVKKSGHKTVSMLQKQKNTARKRSHS